MATTPGLHPDHVVVVVEENHGYSQIIGSPDAPYINVLAAQGALFTQSHALLYSSQPNYFALLSGSTQGVVDGLPHHFSAPTLAGELQAAGLSFLGYAEAGSPRKHDPWQSFTDTQAIGRDFSQFPTDFSKLPTVAFISPNLVDNMHDGTVAQGDQWLRDHLSAYADWAQTHNSLLIVTFDEDAGIIDPATSQGNHIPTIVVGAGVTTGQNPQPITHYNVLRTIEDMYGLPPLGETAAAAAMNLTGPASTSTTISLQEGVNGYTGTVDTQLRQADPATSYGGAAMIGTDADTPSGTGQKEQALLRFDHLFGPDAGQVPLGAHIISATLALHTTNPGDGAELHRMLTPWSYTDTWNSLSGGVHADGVQAMATADLVTGRVTDGTTTLDVTKSVQAWASATDPNAANLGWAFLPSGPDSWGFDSAQGTFTPQLTVTYDAAPLSHGQEIDWNALAAQVTANFLATGHWFV